jgi:hypothetical protein
MTTFVLKHANSIAFGALILGLLSLVEGCVTITAAPGSDRLRLTQNPGDVSACTAVGNIKAGDQPRQNIPIEFRNQAVGFGANTALVTVAVLGTPIEGVAYRCP